MLFRSKRWRHALIAMARSMRIAASRKLIGNIARKRMRTLARYRDLKWSMQGLQKHKAYLRQSLIQIGFSSKIPRGPPRIVDDFELTKEWESRLEFDPCDVTYTGNQTTLQRAMQAVVRHSIVTGAGRTFPQVERNRCTRSLEEPSKGWA